MRAAILPAFRSPYIVKAAHPQPPAPTGHDILVRVQAASYCHTDHVYASGMMAHNPEPPLIPCHEFAGIVEELGLNVSPSLGIRRGTRVGVPGRAFRPCGSCAECSMAEAAGDPPRYGVWCPLAGNLGLSVDGGMAEFALADSRQVAPLPDGMAAVQAAPMMCAGVTVWAALAKAVAAVPPGQGLGTVAVMGAGGGLGHLGVQFAASMGWKKVIAVDAVDASLKILQDIVDAMEPEKGRRVDVVNAMHTTASEVLERLWPDEELQGKRKGERGADAVLILPESQRAFDYGVSLVRNHGTAVVVSFPEKGFNMSAQDLVFRDIRVVGSLVGRNYQLKEMLRFAQEHRVMAKVQSWPLENINGLVDAYLKASGGKLVVDMELRGGE